jgi:hypothetical protein
MTFRIASAVALAGLALSFAAPSLAQKTVPGEMWRQTMSMEAAGMKMPGRTSEICVPIGKAAESLARPQDNDKCEMSDMKSTANGFSATMRCAGKEPMEGTIDSRTEGNTVKSRMQMKMNDMSMTMNSESTKLGAACQAKDWSTYKPPVVAAQPQPQMPDTCSMAVDQMKKSSSISNMVTFYAGKDAQCAKHASFKTYCSAVQTPAGFYDLSKHEKSMAIVKEGRDNPSVQPLTYSMQACGLGQGKPAIDALRTKMLASAESQGAWDFMIAEGNDATFQTLGNIAKRECTGRSYTSAANSKYLGLCRTYGMALIRGDRAAVLNAAGIDSSAEPPASAASPGGLSPGATSPGSASQGRSGSAEPPHEREEEPAPSGTKEKAKATLDKGKKALRGLFGGGGD